MGEYKRWLGIKTQSQLKRIIARLDIKGNRLVKGINLEGWRFLPLSPNEYCYQYYLQGADEIIYIDAVASLYGRDSIKEIIKKSTENVFIPITVGGGVRSAEDAYDILRNGADKVAICSQAVKTPEIISEVANKFGNQCMVLSIQAKKDVHGQYKVWYDVAREKTDMDVIEWAQKGESMGAGEILLTDIDAEGMEKGMNLDLIQRVSAAVSIPVIASGGIGLANDALMAFNAGADAVALAKSLHYGKLTIADIKKQSGSHKFRIE